MINVLLLTAMAQADPHVSLSVRARPLKEVLATLTEQSGIKLSCAPEHANEIMVIKFKDEPVSTVKKKLAWALDAEWKQNQTESILVRSELRTREIAAQAAEARQAKAQVFLDKVREKLKATPTAYERIQAFLKPPKGGNLDEPWQESPAGWYLLQIWLDLGPVAVSSAPSDGYLTYSNVPNGAQKKLPDAAINHLAAMEEELGQLSQSVQNDQRASFYLKDFNYQISHRPMKYIVKLYQMGSASRIWLTAYGAAGELLFSSGNSSTNFGTNAYSAADEIGKRAPAESFELTGLQKEFNAIREPHAEYSGVGDEIPNLKASAELTEALINPERVDPLDFWNTEAIIAWGKDKEICVCLPDRFDFATRSCLQPGKFQLGKLKAIAEPVGTLKTFSEPQWLLGRPTNGPLSEKTRFNRAVLGRFLRANYAAKAEQVQAAASYMFDATKQASFFGFWSTYRKTLWRLGVDPLDDLESHPYEAWALLGSFKLSIPELQQGASVTFASANPKQKQLMTNLAISGFLEPEPDAKLRDIQTEPTEWMTNGLPGETSYAVLGVQQYAIRRILPKGAPKGMNEPIRTAGELGKAATSWSSFDLASYGEVDLGLRSRLLSRFKPTAGLVFEDPYFIGFEPIGKTIKAKDLPPDFIKAAEQAYREAKRKDTN